MKTTTKILITLLTLAGFSGAFAKNGNGGNQNQAGGLPALAEEVAELRALLEDLQGQIGDGSDPYVGRYSVNLVEWSSYGCGISNDPFAAAASGMLLSYLANQGISSTITRTANFEVDSDGMTLFTPQYTLLSQELRLSGQYEEDTRIEGGYNVAIAADGSLSVPQATAQVSGQMSADGSAFTLLVRETFDDNGCDDAYAVLLTGVKK